MSGDLVFQTRFGDVIFGAESLTVLASFQQKKMASREAGGQLFGRILENRTLNVTVATGPTRGAIRTRYSYQPDRRREKLEIATHHKSGLHYLGDWHSHPESHPSPSASDTEKVMAIFDASRHDLNCLLMVIVGTADFPEGLWVGAVSATGVERANHRQE